MKILPRQRVLIINLDIQKDVNKKLAFLDATGLLNMYYTVYNVEIHFSLNF